MGLLGDFEQRLERAVEGFFARVFRSGVHPVEIGKRLLRVMEDGKVVTLKRTYAPSSYQIVLSEADYARVAPLEAKLVEELEVFVGEVAQSRGWTLASAPRVSFRSAPRQSPGEFRIEAEPVSLPGPSSQPAPAAAPAQGSGAVAVAEAPVRAPTGSPVLVILSDQGEKTYPISGTVRIGRQADNDLVISDPGVSRHHAQVVSEGSAVVVKDLGSTNGTTVNGSLVREHRLRNGDRILIGHTLIEFHGP